MVGHVPLEHGIYVRIVVSEPTCVARILQYEKDFKHSQRFKLQLFII